MCQFFYFSCDVPSAGPSHLRKRFAASTRLSQPRAGGALLAPSRSFCDLAPQSLPGGVPSTGPLWVRENSSEGWVRQCGSLGVAGSKLARGATTRGGRKRGRKLGTSAGTRPGLPQCGGRPTTRSADCTVCEERWWRQQRLAGRATATTGGRPGSRAVARGLHGMHRTGVGPLPSSGREEPSASRRGADHSQHRVQTRLTPAVKCSEHGQTHAATNWKNHVAFSTAIIRPRMHWKLFGGSGLLTQMVDCDGTAE